MAGAGVCSTAGDNIRVWPKLEFGDPRMAMSKVRVTNIIHIDVRKILGETSDNVVVGLGGLRVNAFSTSVEVD